MNFADVKEWRIPVEGVIRDVIRVTDTNNTRVIWEKLSDHEYLKRLADTYDPTIPSAKNIVIKNITSSTITLTLTSRQTSKFTDDNTYTYTLTYYDNNFSAHSLVFSINNLSYNITVNSNEIVSFDFVDHTDDLLGYTPPTILASSGYIVLIGGGSTTNKRMPFRFNNASKIVDSSRFSWTINNDTAVSTTNLNGSFMNLFSNCSDMIYPANLQWGSEFDPQCQYLYYQTFFGCSNLERTMSSPIRVPSTIYNISMCDQTYRGCTYLTNVDNAIRFEAATTTGTSYANYYANTSCTYSATASGFGVITQILRTTCRQMFMGCTNITSAKFNLPWAMCYAINGISTSNAYREMFNGCTKLVEPPKLERYYCASGTSGNAVYDRGFNTGAYRGIFKNCTSLNKLILIIDSSSTRWYCPDYEYSFSGGAWIQSANKTNTTEWMTIGSEITTGIIYYNISSRQPESQGNTNDGYLPSGWTFSTDNWF